MFDFVSLLGGSDRLTRIARLGDPRAFQDALAAADVHLLEVPYEFETTQSMDAASYSAPDEMSDVLCSLADDERDHCLYRFTHRDRSAIPIFTSMKNVEKFVKSYVQATGNITAFSVLEVRGSVVLEQIESAECWMLNAESRHEMDVTDLLADVDWRPCH